MQLGKQAAAIVEKNISGDNYLTAFIAVNDEFKDYTQVKLFMEMKKEMLASTEYYKVPQKFIFVKSIPVNNNGKINREELKLMLSR